ncbi:unannotated protein [freshwater metagenome]|uniref:Unannotated protein n=1 Tax=freshwater metagenome TaxID=449393 RepID=A0A6J7D8H1_9ZZZZ
MPSALNARLASVFFTTAYDAFARMFPRSSLSCATVSPRYSVSSTPLEVRIASEISAIVASLFAMVLLVFEYGTDGRWQQKNSGANARS